MKLFTKSTAAALLLTTSALPVAAQMSEFKQSNNILTLQLVKVGSQYFSNMTFIMPPPPQAWQLTSKGNLVSPLKAADSAVFDTSTSTVRVPVLKIDNTVYSDVQLKLNSGGSWNVADLGDVLSTATPGYELSYPISSTMPNRYCTDANGELTYKLDNGQVWKHVADDPCCPLQVTIGGTLPDTIAANIAGSSKVEIYPNPGEGPTTGHFRMVVSYTGLVDVTATASSCVKTVADSVWAGTCFSPATGICSPNPTHDAGTVADCQYIPAAGTTPATCMKIATSTAPGSCKIDGLKCAYVKDVNTSACQNVSAGYTYTISQAGVETCVVRPVQGVSNYPVAPGRGPLAVSMAAVTATVGQKATVYITGGLPPYYVTATYPGVVSYELLPETSALTGQGLVVTAKRVGATELMIYDYNRDVQTIAVTSNGIALAPLTISPVSADLPQGEFVDIDIINGIPPIRVINPNNTWVEAPEIVPTTPAKVRAVMKRAPNAEEIKTFLSFEDQIGQRASIELKIKPCKGSPSCGSGGGGIFQ